MFEPFLRERSSFRPTSQLQKLWRCPIDNLINSFNTMGPSHFKVHIWRYYCGGKNESGAISSSSDRERFLILSCLSVALFFQTVRVSYWKDMKIANHRVTNGKSYHENSNVLPVLLNVECVVDLQIAFVVIVNKLSIQKKQNIKLANPYALRRFFQHFRDLK